MTNKERGHLLEFLCWLSGYLHIQNMDYLGIIKAWEESKMMYNLMCPGKEKE